MSFSLLDPAIADSWTGCPIDLRRNALKNFGHITHLLQEGQALPDCLPVTRIMPTELLREWQRCLAMELWFSASNTEHHDTVKTWVQEKFTLLLKVSPFIETNAPTFEQLLEDDVAVCLYPIATDGGLPPGLGLAVARLQKGNQRAECTHIATQQEHQGDSDQLAKQLARLAVERGKTHERIRLVRRFIATGTCTANGEVGPVEMGNKLDLRTKHTWLVASDQSIENPKNDPIRRAATLGDMWKEVTGSSFLSGESRNFSELKIGHLFTLASKAYPPVIASILFSRPKVVTIFHSDEDDSKAAATSIKQVLSDESLASCLPQLEDIKLVRISSSDLNDAEQHIHGHLDSITTESDNGEISMLFNVTNGNFLMKLAAYQSIRDRANTLAIYRDFDTDFDELIAIHPGRHGHPTATFPLKGHSVPNLNVMSLFARHDNDTLKPENIINQLVLKTTD